MEATIKQDVLMQIKLSLFVVLTYVMSDITYILPLIDMYLGVALKAVSIVATVLLAILNWKKIREKFKIK